MDKSEREQSYITCPGCGEKIPVAWWGDKDNIHYCEKCKLLKKQSKSESEDEA